MPVRTYQIPEPGAARVLIYTCEECGSPACASENANILAALRTGNPDKAGRWYCGYREGKPQCIAMKRKDEAA